MNRLVVSALVPFAVLLAPIPARADGPPYNAHPETYLKDSAITAKIKAKIAGEDELRSLVEVIVDTDSKGGVLLRGFVKTKADADKASTIARGTEGVTSVVNRVEVGTP
jgi:hyperosmotically inducible protein